MVSGHHAQLHFLWSCGFLRRVMSRRNGLERIFHRLQLSLFLRFDDTRKPKPENVNA
jgi:hypothetical protein